MVGLEARIGVLGVDVVAHRCGRHCAAGGEARAKPNRLHGLLLLFNSIVDRLLHFKSSGAISLGRISGMSGQTMIAASIRSIGTSMIIVSLSANLTGTLATAHEIIRHSP